MFSSLPVWGIHFLKHTNECQAVRNKISSVSLACRDSCLFCAWMPRTCKHVVIMWVYVTNSHSGWFTLFWKKCWMQKMHNWSHAKRGYSKHHMKNKQKHYLIASYEFWSCEDVPWFSVLPRWRNRAVCKAAMFVDLWKIRGIVLELHKQRNIFVKKTRQSQKNCMHTTDKPFQKAPGGGPTTKQVYPVCAHSSS